MYIFCYDISQIYIPLWCEVKSIYLELDYLGEDFLEILNMRNGDTYSVEDFEQRIFMAPVQC